MLQETGKVIYVGSIERGLSARTSKSWESQTFVIETNERYPRRIALTIMTEDRISKASLREGEVLQVFGFATSHEYNGNWYTEIQCTDIVDNGRSRFMSPVI